MATRPSAAPRTRRPQGALVQIAATRLILTGTSWSPRRELTLTDWMRQGRRLGAVARASGWWVGDWIRFGNARYGEKYAVAAKITGYDAQSLMNMAYVASRFEISRRRERLSFSHHAELAALSPDEQEQWLDRAELEGLSSRRIRAELRRRTKPAGPSDSSCRGAATPGGHSVLPTGISHIQHPPAAEVAVVCPECGHAFQPPPDPDSPDRGQNGVPTRRR